MQEIRNSRRQVKPACVPKAIGLLETVAREGLVKTQQAGKGLVGPVVIFQLWRLAVAL
jgi:hypothetical protein